MTIEILKFSNTLSLDKAIDVVDLSSSSGMTISHYAGGWKASEATLNFEFVGTEEHVPYIDEVEFCAVIRKKVDFTAIGPNEGAIRRVGKDVGKFDYKDSVPRRPSDLPPGFKELYRKP
jgi:hypothetical protein